VLNLKRLVKTIFATILFITSIAAYQTSSSNNQVTLVEATPPLYPPIAVAARAEGEVTVEVTINNDGSVIESKAIAGHKLLQKAAELAAQRWKFSAIEGQATTRKATLSFKFVLVSWRVGIEEEQPIFRPPFQVEIRRKPSHLQ
jgi:TonB family protein